MVLFDVLVYIVVLFTVVKVIQKVKKQNANASGKKTEAFDPPVRATIKKDSLNQHMARENGNTTALRDDRKNDWLAKQLKDEKTALVNMRDMFAFSPAHKYSCEAEMVKRFHEENCDAATLKKSHEEHCDAEGIDEAVI